ncbi:hypothetical protein HK104_003355 [Borealophlyctis nickersoniae]|nr:hypothetical protein HK104_003355 [Borealophlyctis nickersoniae]
MTVWSPPWAVEADADTWRTPYNVTSPPGAAFTVRAFEPPKNGSTHTVPNAPWPQLSKEEMVHDASGIPLGATLAMDLDDFRVPLDGPDPKNWHPGFKYLREASDLLPSPKKYGRPVMDLAAERKDHYDARFYINGPHFSPEERTYHIRAMFAAWASWADKHRIQYWLAHGTLLGWYWGGRIMPWDDDMDLQMNSNMLYELANYNMSLVADRYLIDVNPHFVARYRQLPNVIDARFIDTQTALFLDITGVAYVGTRRAPMAPGDIPPSKKSIVQCKTPHLYRIESLTPLVRTVFEGVPTWRPNGVMSILAKEYSMDGTKRDVYKGYKFDYRTSRWTRLTSCEALYAAYISPTHRKPTPERISAEKVTWKWNVDANTAPSGTATPAEGPSPQDASAAVDTTNQLPTPPSSPPECEITIEWSIFRDHFVDHFRGVWDGEPSENGGEEVEEAEEESDGATDENEEVPKESEEASAERGEVQTGEQNQAPAEERKDEGPEDGKKVEEGTDQTKTAETSINDGKPGEAVNEEERESGEGRGERMEAEEGHEIQNIREERGMEETGKQGVVVPISVVATRA